MGSLYFNSEDITRVFFKILLSLVIFFFLSIRITAQSRLDSLFDKINPQKWSAVVKKKASRLEKKIVAKTEKTLSRLQKQEEKIYKNLLSTKDSLYAKAQLAEIQNRYDALRNKINNPPTEVSALGIKEYVPWVDSTQTALKFLSNQGVDGNVKDALSKVESLNGRLQDANEIKQFIRERREQLKQQLENLGLVKELKKINKGIYYYSQQINEYKEILKDPKKIERKALELLSRSKPFQDFMRNNSILASLFRMPGNPSDPNYTGSLAGLQTRATVNNLIQQQLASGGPNARQQFQNNLQQAQSQLNELKNKAMKFGGGSSDDIMSEGFRKNSQKTKRLIDRLEVGTNFQSQKATNLFPVTSDIGLSFGFRANDNSILGLGGSAKIGFGRGWNNINITSQGLSIRSFFDYKIKSSFWFTAGYEMNYKSEIRNITQLKDQTVWIKSCLVGISKTVSIKSKLFKKTKVQILWDALSYRHPGISQPIVFRVGYNF